MSRSSIAARIDVRDISKKFISTFFAAMLALGLVPAAAFAAPENSDDADAPSTTPLSVGTEPAPSSGDAETLDNAQALGDLNLGETSNGEEPIEENVANFDDSNLTIPAASSRINETMTLQTRTVAQAESTRTYFLAQTLESTRTVPIVSANLPLDTGNNESNVASQDEGGDDGEDDPEGDDSVGASFSLRTEDDQADSGSNGIAMESTVIGSFTYRGITYAVEPGGETVAVVAVDYNQLPEAFIENQVIVLPSMVTADGLDYYTVSRIADYAFSAITLESVGANLYGCANGEDGIEDNAITEDGSTENPEGEDAPIGITAITIPASITSIGDAAFAGADTLQYVVVSEDNPLYSSYDGCLYDADQTCLLLIPEGRLGAVWVAPSVTTIDPEVFSHCALVDTVVADPNSAAYQLLQENALYNASDSPIIISPIGEDVALYSPESDARFQVANIDGMTTSSEEILERNSSYASPSPNKSGYNLVISGPHYVSEVKTLHELWVRPADVILTEYWRGTQYIPFYADFNGGLWVMGFNGQLYIPQSGNYNPQYDIAFGPCTKETTGWFYCVTCNKKITYDIPESGAAKVHEHLNATYQITWHNYIAYDPSGATWPEEAYPFTGYKAENQFIGNLAEWAQPVSATGPDNGILPIPPQGQRLSGWSSEAGGKGTFYAKGALIPISTSPRAVYAVYVDNAITWDVSTFGGNTAQVSPVSDTNHIVENVTGSPNNKLEKVVVTDTKQQTGETVFPEVADPSEGVRFKGWTDKADGSAPEGGYKKPGESLTVGESTSTHWYAVWTIDVNWDTSKYAGQLSNGDTSTTTSVILNTAADLPSVADMGTGWKFEGWVPKGTAASGATMTKPTITAAMAANNTDGVVDGYEGVWSLSVTYQREADAIADMTIDGASNSGYGTLTKSGIIYGTTVTAPTTGSPVSHHFSHWTTSNGVDSVAGANEGDPHTIVITAPGAVTAYWAPNSRKVVLNNGGTPEVPVHPESYETYAVYGEPMKPLPPNATGDGWDEDATKLVAPTRPGYEFVGYWNTPYDETSGKKYLEADPADKAPDGTPYLKATDQTWDITNNTQQLYAHWKYRIYLSMNSMDSDGTAVTGAGAGAIDASSISGALLTDARGTYIETIDGAPIQLPKVTGRTGYYDEGKGTDGTTPVNAAAWGVRLGRYGWSTGIVPLNASGTTADDPTKLTLSTSNITATRAYDNAAYFTNQDATAVKFPVPDETTGSITLYLNWENRPKVYDVTLTSAYDVFSVSNAPTGKVKAVYDAPILMERNGATIVYADFVKSGATGGIIAPEKISGSGADAHHDYIFKGFRTAMNELDGMSGEEYIGAKVEGTGAAITAVASAVTRPWRTDETNPVLYAAWGRVKSTLTLNLNGGELPSVSGSEVTVMDGTTEFTFEAGKPTPNLPAAYAAAPEREGYIFRGYYTEATGDGAAYARFAEDGTNTAYYVANDAENPTAAVPANLDWDFYTNITLYAHWEYKIDFRLNHSVDCASSNPSGVHTAITLKSAPVVAGVTDKYGNRYPAGGAEVTASETNLVVTALAGVPVMVPVAHNRNGYNDTLTWQVRENDSATGTGLEKVTGDKTTYYTPGVPFPSVTPSTNQHTIIAYVDWTGREKTYWVEIISNVTDSSTLGTNIVGATPQYMKVKFNDTFPTDATTGNVLTAIPRDTDDTRNLVFTGIYSLPAGIGDTSGVCYVTVSDGATAPLAAFVPKTRSDNHDIKDALVTEANASSATALGTHPIPVYARWAYPSCYVSFNMNTGNIDGASEVRDAFELKTKDALPRLSTLTGDAAALATAPIKRADGLTSGASDYTFDGYWSTASGGKQYYDKDGAPTVDEWDFAGATTLYAHWTYKIRLNLNGSVPESLQAAVIDGLTVNKANDIEAEPAPVAVASGDAATPVRAYEMTIVWGADATVPATTANVKRVRYEKPYSEAAAKTVQSDYTFAGWLASASAETVKFPAGANVGLGGESKRDAVVPTAGTVNLYAKWTCAPYLVTLDYKGGVSSLTDTSFATDDAGNAVTGEHELSNVVFDKPVYELGEALPAPHRLGYTFEGYFALPQSQDATHASACYLEPVGDGMAATTELWPSYRGKAAVLYAHYTQNKYNISFAAGDDMRPVGEPTEAAGGNAIVSAKVRIPDIENVTYQTMLDTKSSTDYVLSCDGYEFGGWFTERDGALDRMMFDEEGAGQGSYALEDSVTLFPKWTPRTWNVTWDFNVPAAAGTQIKSITTTETYNQMRTSKAPADPEVIGYTFDGWFRNPQKAEKRWDSNNDPFRPVGTDLAASGDAGGIIYYAHWTAVKYTVTLLPGAHGTYKNKEILWNGVQPDGSGGLVFVHHYTMQDGNWSLSTYKPEPDRGWEFQEWEQVVEAEDGSGWTVVDEHAPFYVNVASFAKYPTLTFRAVWAPMKANVTLNLGECEGERCDGAALGDFPQSFKYGIGISTVLPDDLVWPGYTFQGWQLTKRDGAALADQPVKKGVEVKAAENENPPSLEYTACWVRDAYTIEFVMSKRAEGTVIASPVTFVVDDAGETLPLTRDAQFTFPQPAFRNGFVDGNVKGEYLEDASGYIFSHYVTAMGGTYLPGQTCSVAQLLAAFPGLTDTKGDEPHDGSVIRLYGDWGTEVYHVDVPLVASIAFDPDHVDDSIKPCDVNLFVRRADQNTVLEVVGLICDPIAAAGTTTPGTSGTFDDNAAILDGTYLTLAAKKGKQPAADDGDRVELNLGQVARNAGNGVTVQSAMTSAGVKSLRDLGFAFGGASEDDRTLTLTFGLRFDDGVDASQLRFLNSNAFKNTGKTVPIAKVYYTLAMAR